MEIERGIAGGIPYAAVGVGQPVVVCCGLWPTTGVESDRLVRGSVTPLRKTSGRRIVIFNRRSNMQPGLTMEQLAAEYADAMRILFGGPVDLSGFSTGGSIAQQVAADHPSSVRRLVLVSTAWRLEGESRASQAEVAAHIRVGDRRSAAAAIGADLAPRGFRGAASRLFWLAGNPMFRDAQAANDLATTLEAEDQFDLSRRPQIQAPTLIVGGGRDRYYTSQQFTETAALIPTSQLHIEKRRGHVSVGSSPRVQLTISAFLNA